MHLQDDEQEEEEEEENHAADAQTELTLAGVHFFETLLNDATMVDKCTFFGKLICDSGAKCRQRFTIHV